MRLIETYKAYRALDPVQRRLLKDKQIRGVRTPGQWVALLGGLAVYDRLADSVRTRSAVLMVAVPIAVFFAVLLGSSMLGYEELALPAAIALALALAAPFVAIFLATRSTDLPNRLRDLAIPLVSLIGEDLGPNGTLRLALDLRAGTADSKLRTSPPPSSRGGRSVRERIFLDPWMTGTASLSDGARLHWRLTEEIRERRVSRRNARGKTKTKTKYRVKSLTQVALDLPVASYRLHPAATRAGAGVRVSTRDKWHKLRGRRSTRQKGLEPASAPLKEVLRSITDLYSLAVPVAQKESSHV